jgi:hypothetical protein
MSIFQKDRWSGSDKAGVAGLVVGAIGLVVGWLISTSDEQKRRDAENDLQKSRDAHLGGRR